MNDVNEDSSLPMPSAIVARMSEVILQFARSREPFDDRDVIWTPSNAKSSQVIVDKGRNFASGCAPSFFRGEESE